MCVCACVCAYVCAGVCAGVHVCVGGWVGGWVWVCEEGGGGIKNVWTPQCIANEIQSCG